MRVIDFIEQEAPLIKTKDGGHMSAFQVLEWFLFPKAQQYAQVGSLSGGERRRLYLLYILMHQPNVLLLDEPTNDLDIPTLTILEEFLDHFQGSLVVASHDRYFLDRTVDYLVSFEHGQIGPRYPAPYSTYQQLRYEESRQQIQAVQPDSGPTGKSSRSTSRPRKLTWKEQRELDQLEGDIADLETEKEKLAVAINTSGNDYAKLQKLADQLQVVETKLEAMMERWLELSELAE
jgi:ATP-binding cassette subfamily F protein uup